MRLLLLVLLPGLASADPLRHEDPLADRPELIAMTARHEVLQGARWVETAREVSTYDRAGRVIRREQARPDGTVIGASTYQRDPQGRMTSHEHREGTSLVARVDYTYKLDAQGRVVEKVIRDPAQPAGQYRREVYVHEADGSQAVTTYRHYAAEGPYRSDTRRVDAQGRITRECREHGGCSMLEYDAHGVLEAIRQQTKAEHHYLYFETTYDRAGRIASRTLGTTRSDYTWNARGDVTEVRVGTVARSFYTYRYR